MTNDRQFILKDNGFPVTAGLRGMKAITIHPQNAGAWICLYLETDHHESQAEQDRWSEFLPPERFQLAIDPAHAHQLGLYLIQKAKDAVAPDPG